MERLDGRGQWANPAIVHRYRAWCGRLRIEPAAISASEGVFADRGWACAVIGQIIAGIEKGDAACAWIGIELIEEDGGFVFGRMLKARTARALRRAVLDEAQKHRIRERVLAMLNDGFLPHEFRQYSRLAARIGLGPLRRRFEELSRHPGAWVRWYAAYLTTASRAGPRERRRSPDPDDDRRRGK